MRKNACTIFLKNGTLPALGRARWPVNYFTGFCTNALALGRSCVHDIVASSYVFVYSARVRVVGGLGRGMRAHGEPDTKGAATLGSAIFLHNPD